MLHENEDSIFEIGINAEGATALETVNRLARILLVVALILTLLVSGIGMVRYLYFLNFDTAGNLYSIIELRIFPLLSIAMMFLNFYQLTLYVKFTRQCSRSIRDRDQHSFNQSFKTMRKSMTMLMWVVCIEVITGSYSLFAGIRDYLRVS